MPKTRTSIRRRLMTSLMVTSGVVLILISVAFFIYEVVSFRRLMVRGLMLRSEILAANSTAALAFENEDDARELLAALKKDPHMTAACLYDSSGRVFATYPADAPREIFPSVPATLTHGFEESHFVLFRPVVQENRRLGTLYFKSDLTAMTDRLRVYALVVGPVTAACVLVAFVLAFYLQKRILQPVHALVEMARTVAADRDYSRRVRKGADDELGLLTDCFNEMLDQIQIRDSSLRKSEAGMRAVMESALDSIVTMDHEGRIVEFNPAAEKAFGYERSSAVGARVADLLTPLALREQHLRGLAHYLATGNSTVLGRRVELTAMRADGAEFPVEMAITRIAQDGPPKFTAFIRDITARRRAEQEIRQLNEDLEARVVERTAQLEASNKELEAFSYSVSHDLRAPLRAIDGFSQILLEEKSQALDEDGRRLLGVVRQNTVKMGQLIDDLLSFSRLGRTAMQRAPVDMTRLARAVADELEAGTQGRRVSLTIGELPRAEGDSAMLRQVWLNLISNALKYSGSRATAEIEIRGEVQGPEAVYSVKDNGVGFDMQYASKLFGVFQRLHSSTDFEGTGVGLALVQRIVARHGGRIWADAKLEEGATFSFTLPAAVRTGHDHEPHTQHQEVLTHA